MEYILELDQHRQITIPEEVSRDLKLEPGAHFTARYDAGRLVIESLPFSSQEQAESLQRTVESLQKD